jgi:hypothetical protein
MAKFSLNLRLLAVVVALLLSIPTWHYGQDWHLNRVLVQWENTIPNPPHGVIGIDRPPDPMPPFIGILKSASSET